jgi:SpoVK/Ycf46/Vps4 family AAA+-type ATPase
LFIDEAYSLGNIKGTESDSFSRDCVDTINKFLSENTSNFIMIIAGYREDLDNCFFSMNRGLRRRFPWTYNIDKYTPANLKDIFVYQVLENRWNFDESLKLNGYSELLRIFSDPQFDNNGGDTLMLFDKTKICHSRRVFGKRQKYKKTINLADITLAFELLKSHKNKNKNKIQEAPFGMYV